MTKLLITEITRMGPAFCVIGLQREKEKIQSIRPVPAFTNGWKHFPHHRGDILECALAPFPGASTLMGFRSSSASSGTTSISAETLRMIEISASRSPGGAPR